MATIHPTATNLLQASPTDNGHPDRWSRTIGALGGTAIWQRLTTLRPCIIGVSRTGSLIATSLAQMGVQTLGLIDPDVVEAHHLDAMDGVTPHDLGRPKGAAVAAHVQALCPALTVTALPHRVTEHPALVRIKEADVLFCCVDNDAARLVTTTLATLYLKPLIDVGTGILSPPPTTPQSAEVGTIAPPAPRQMGGDVRCVLPSDACLLCAGGLVREAEAHRTLTTWISVRATHLTVPWNQQRAGSLRSLNHLAAHLGVQMWLDLVAGRLDASCWAQVEFDDMGRLRVGYPALATSATASRCVLCAKAGLGDAGLGWLAL